MCVCLGHDGNWLSSGDKVTIDSVSGISVADRVGSSQIIYNVSYAVTQTTVSRFFFLLFGFLVITIIRKI